MPIKSSSTQRTFLNNRFIYFSSELQHKMVNNVVNVKGLKRLLPMIVTLVSWKLEGNQVK